MGSTHILSGQRAGVAAFVGRELERAKVANLLADARVVTFTGTGGCGKTRLAVEVVGDVASRFADGVRWVDLQAVSEPGLVASAVARAMDVYERPDERLARTLATHLRGRRQLVVLDNCEHLVESCAALVSELSAACPHLRVLATSRVPLVVDGEATFDVAPLPVPDAGVVTASTVAAADAARLFEVRARQVVTDFRIGEDNAPAVAEICRRLDGIPLAIELAAARVRVLAPAQIEAGLSDRFGLLTKGVRGAPARQRTLQASLDWSYDLLDDVQRLALARMSVFVGSFELDAAEAALAGKGIERDAVLDLVAGLVEHSLVQVDQRQGRARYRLLETIRMYARQRLCEMDDPDEVRGRHLQFFAALARRAHAGLRSGQPEPWVARLTAELDDLRAAMDSAVAAGNLRALVDLTEPLVRFWFEHGLSREVHQQLHDAATSPGVSDDERVPGLQAAAALAFAGGEPASCYLSATQAVAAARAAGLVGALAVALGHRALSGVLAGLATDEQVEADVEQALDLATRCGDAATHAHVLQFAGAALLNRRSIDAGHRLFQQGVQVCEENHLVFHTPAAYAGHVLWSVWSGQLDRTASEARRAVELSHEVGRPAWEAAGLTGLAAVAVLQGDHLRAQERLAQADAVLGPRALNATHYGMWVRHWHALSAYASGDLGAARATSEEIVRIGRGGGSRLDEAIGDWILGMVAQSEERVGDARAHLESSRALSTEPGLPHTLGRALLGLAQLAAQDEDFEEAWELTHRSLEVLGDYGDSVGAAAALETLAELALALEHPERALRLLAASQRFHADMGIARFPLYAAVFGRARAAAVSALGDAEATACWDAGSRLTLAEAVAYAGRGRGERLRPRSGWESLTPAELDVVRLVAEGNTNAAIGQRLFMSVNTVKKHLSHVYAKVGVEGRADLAAQVARRSP